MLRDVLRILAPFAWLLALAAIAIILRWWC